MVANSNISWTDHTWNPWIGCTKVSPACDNCYAEAWAKRYGRAEWGNHPRQRTAEATWRAPRKWDRETPGAFVFCASLADIFDNQVDPQWRADAFAVMRETPNLTYLLLTKRPQNIEKLSPDGLPPNAAIGCTVVTQQELDRDAPVLLAAKARMKPAFAFLSIEPMLGAIDLFHALPRVGVVSSKPIRQRGIPAHIAGVEERTMMLAGVDWVICGGESGPQARAIEADWVRELRDQCTKKHVPFHFKQWGGRTPKANGKELDGREWCERPTPQFRRAA